MLQHVAGTGDDDLLRVRQQRSEFSRMRFGIHELVAVADENDDRQHSKSGIIEPLPWINTIGTLPALAALCST